MCGINHRNTEQVKQAERLDQKVMVQLAGPPVSNGVGLPRLGASPETYPVDSTNLQVAQNE
jgi:hypothetical protein